MINSLGEPQSVLLLGGTSDIALATVRAWASVEGLPGGPAAPPTARPRAASADPAGLGIDVRELDLEAEQPQSHPELGREAFENGDIDVAVVALGVLEDEE